MASVATTVDTPSPIVPQYEILAADPELAKRKQSADNENTSGAGQEIGAGRTIRNEDAEPSSSSHNEIQPPSEQERAVKQQTRRDSPKPFAGQEKGIAEERSRENTLSAQHDVGEESNRLPDTYFAEKLFQSDNTGTRKFKNLMRGLKNIIVRQYEPSENPDLMPKQLASYYGDLNGDYNQLFHKTPNPSIAFIYKSLGCSYSLQPNSNADKVEEPDVPALKTAGWIMWSTIQMLLGPDEHAGFLMEAVKRWDVIDPESGKVFPKALPRECLPATADQRMSDWYEGVSERLDKEVEEVAELRQRQRAVEQHAESRRMAIGQDDDEHTVDSRGPALAYFRNPLYRHVDGRPSIVRHSSKRPAISPRHSILDKGKGAVTTVGHVIRNVTSPHLWDGNGRDRRRRSVPDGRYHHPGEPPPSGVPREDRLPGPGRQGSPRQGERRASAHGSQSSQHLRPRKDDRDHALRHSRSHDPTPSERESDDYFQQGGLSPRHDHESIQEEKASAFGPSFAPSPGLPFAARVARQQAEYSRQPRRPMSGRGGSSVDRREKHDDSRTNASPRNRSRSRYDDRLPYDDRPRHDNRRSLDERRRHSRSQHDFPSHNDRPRHDDRGRLPEERRRHEEVRDRHDHPPDSRRLSGGGHGRSASRRSHGGDMDSAHSGPEDSDRRSNRKQARFATEPISGVDGRRYVNQSPWQSQG